MAKRKNTKANRLFEAAARMEFEKCDRDEAKRRRDMYRRAAIRGSSKAQFFLALDYAYGRDHVKNHRLAMAWFRRAAFAGEELCDFLVKRGENTLVKKLEAFGRLLRGL